MHLFAIKIATKDRVYVTACSLGPKVASSSYERKHQGYYRISYAYISGRPPQSLTNLFIRFRYNEYQILVVKTVDDFASTSMFAILCLIA
jgi:hypothetical protein